MVLSDEQVATLKHAILCLSQALDSMGPEESSRACAQALLTVADSERDAARREEIYDFAIAFLMHARRNVR